MDAKLLVKLVPAELRHGYTFNRHGIVTNPGKFEGESIATLYYYDCLLNGGDAVFEITDEERKAFDIGEGYKATYLYESNDGFVYLYFYTSMDEAEQAEAEDYIE
jgi:hypothetical protein